MEKKKRNIENHKINVYQDGMGHLSIILWIKGNYNLNTYTFLKFQNFKIFAKKKHKTKQNKTKKRVLKFGS